MRSGHGRASSTQTIAWLDRVVVVEGIETPLSARFPRAGANGFYTDKGILTQCP